jgi:hypothetical protein
MSTVDRRQTWIWGLGIATITAVTAFGVASWRADAAPGPSTSPGVSAEQPTVSDPSPPAERAAGTGTDPLTTDELGKARAAALSPQLAAQARDVAGKAGPEYLSAELDESGGRTADVYFYDYKTNKLFKQIVDLDSGKLTKSYDAAGLQLPAAKREVTAAFDLLLADPLGAEFKTAYRTTTGKDYAGPDDVAVTAHIYHARPADTGAAQCGKHRCLQLVVESANGVFIDVNDIIIDLSGRTVARLK